MGYSQNNEDEFILNYFGDYKGTLLEIGANNGNDLSNSKLLIENGWTAHLVEPGKAFGDLQLRYSENPNVQVYKVGIGGRDKKVRFWDSGSHVFNGNDTGLVSTTNFEETKRWPGVQFTETEIQLLQWNTFYRHINTKLDFISIDVEGADWAILSQINLKAVGCKVLCIEYNSNAMLFDLFVNYCRGYRLAMQNMENLIFVSE